MALDIKVTIDQKKVLNGAGFGLPLIFVGLLEEEVPYTECGNLEEVALLFGAESKAYGAARRMFAQNLPPAKIALYGGTDNALTALAKIWENPWRQLVVASEASEENTLQEIAALVEEKGGKVYFTSVDDLALITGGEKAITGFTRTSCLFYPPLADCPEAALVGATAALGAGSFSYKNQVLQTLSPQPAQPAQEAEAERLGCWCVLQKAGQVVSGEGKAANGEYLDILDSRDYLIAEIETRTQRLLNSLPKVSYDNNGIALLESVCVNVLAEAFAKGMIAQNTEGLPDYTVDYAPRSQTNPADRAARRYVEGRFGFALAGAVHEAVVRGTIEI